MSSQLHAHAQLKILEKKLHTSRFEISFYSNLITAHKIACLVIQTTNVLGASLKAIDFLFLVICIFFMFERQIMNLFPQSSPSEPLPHMSCIKIGRLLLTCMYKVDAFYVMLCLLPVDKLLVNSRWSILCFLLIFLDHLLRMTPWSNSKREGDLSSIISQHYDQLWLVAFETYVYAGRSPVVFFSDGIDTSATLYSSTYILLASIIFHANLFVARSFVVSYSLHSARAKQPSKTASGAKSTGRGFISGILISNVLVSNAEIIHDLLILLDFGILAFFGVWIWKNQVFSELCAMMMPFHTISVIIALRIRQLDRSLYRRK
mmetsp:Transcript_19021/g.62535  ORF Transcript_19021/g.62535 Transcript_19021/m.62535 type:complete len:319 (+) Transcript_19021:63-1019(+)